MSYEPCCTLDITGSEEDKLIGMFKAIGNPIRFEIMKFLLTHPQCITADVVDQLPLAQSTISQHLKVLKQADWIQATAVGSATSYCLNDEAIRWFSHKVGEIF